ncbi:methylmalonyl Co-A mutase-associated GTPase MeaB, partial [Bacteroidota bacterium]
ITGPPGAGKSTLSGRLIEQFVAQGRSVAYLGVDPSSPVLGDRIRLGGELGDRVFIRSAASRGAQGGLSVQTEAIADVLDAAGFDILLIESVGVGQAELDIVQVVDSVVVVLVPESGDEVQAMKAGLLEIGNVLCVNKADRASAEALITALTHAVGMRSESPRRQPEVTRSIGIQAGGVDQLLEAIQRHYDSIRDSGQWMEFRDDRLRRRVKDIVKSKWEERFWTDTRIDLLRSAIDSMDTLGRTPYELASLIIEAGESR